MSATQVTPDSAGCNEPGSPGALPDGTEFIVSFCTDSGVSLPHEGPLEMGVEIHFPKHLVEPAVALVCLPGGTAHRLPGPRRSSSHDFSAGGRKRGIRKAR